MITRKTVYADNAATTRISQRVLDTMMPYLTDQFGNASGIYSLGRNSKKAVETGREKAAAFLNCSPKEVYFTSGGTESDNWALQGVFRALSESGKDHIITSMTEHHAVLNTCEMIKKLGGKITFLRPDRNGVIDPHSVAAALTPRTALVSVMHVNNETGVIQPVSEIGKICRESEILFHCDAVQAAGHIKPDPAENNIDLMSFSGHKIHAPKGIGALYVNTGTQILNLIYGGQQERTMRPGTENTAAVAGLGEAFSETAESAQEKSIHLRKLYDLFTEGLSEINGASVNSIPDICIPGICSVTFKGTDSEAVVLMLDRKGVCVSGGSACTTGSDKPSHVLLAMGMSPADAGSTVRFSFDEYNTVDDISYILDVLPEIIKKAR